MGIDLSPPAPAPLNPEDPEIVAAIEKAMAPVMEGAAAANAEQALSAAACLEGRGYTVK
jgi:hypothetical protein